MRKRQKGETWMVVVCGDTDNIHPAKRLQTEQSRQPHNKLFALSLSLSHTQLDVLPSLSLQNKIITNVIHYHILSNLITMFTVINLISLWRMLSENYQQTNRIIISNFQ
jgi:hypothetical protein